MFELERAIGILEKQIAMYQAESEAQPYRDNALEITALEVAINSLRNEQHAEMLVMDEFALEFEAH